jgi:hypothetical protein
VTSAGACQRELEGPLPSPEELGAGRFPEAATVGGLDATYARLAREEPDGEQCFTLLRVDPAGVARLGTGCSSDGVEALVADEDVWTVQERLGDYAYGGERVWLRIVEWDPLAEEVVLDQVELAACGTELRPTEAPEPFLVVHPYRLVTGDPPPDAPPCEPGSP